MPNSSSCRLANSSARFLAVGDLGVRCSTVKSGQIGRQTLGEALERLKAGEPPAADAEPVELHAALPADYPAKDRAWVAALPIPCWRDYRGRLSQSQSLLGHEVDHGNASHSWGERNKKPPARRSELKAMVSNSCLRK
jgi:hypothetical protein